MEASLSRHYSSQVVSLRRPTVALFQLGLAYRLQYGVHGLERFGPLVIGQDSYDRSMSVSALIRRSNLEKRKALLPVVALTGLLLSGIAQNVLAFGFDDVAKKAEDLSKQGYSEPERNLPEALRNLDYGQYEQIQYKRDRDVWSGDEGVPFTLSFFHEGMHYDSAIQLHSVDDQGVHDFAFNADDFTYGNLDLADDVKNNDGLGIAGFKVNYALNQSDRKDETMVFLGASYFRVIGKDQVYGVSGRGLAVDTGLPSGEEFPRFKEFWIVKPSKASQYLTIFALLDSPSLTGAYRFVLRPGDDTVVDVKSSLFLRRPVEKLGVAPLTSMYLYGPEQPSSTLNYRPAIHDSNGLLISDSQNGWTWRPLANPAKLMMNEQATPRLRGYGLMQRDHDFDNYQDIDSRYDLRPSAWIEPQNEWGAGKVELIQIPTPNETNDNIVSMWLPETAPEPQPDKTLDYDYRLTVTKDESRYLDSSLAWVDQTRRSRGEVRKDDLVREADGSTAFVLDFVGPSLSGLGDDANISVQASVGDNGELVDSHAERNPATGGWRVFVKIKRSDKNQPLDIRAHLNQGDKRVSETWYYRLPANG
ncbi:glucan biosynthesis protein G [Salinicola halophyticus]|uniref:glucan biosynthesis protein G n=1 Tax=Salinicola halophyticus TaxID=1808881 RepID=UPI001FD9EB0C|nr:glucan biosynthesis protein G [Salinicola halophyticus]